MRRITLVLISIATGSVLPADEIAELKLTNGTVYRKARIVEYNEGWIVVQHEGGSAKLKADLVDLEIVARAKIALDDAADRERELAREKLEAAHRRAETKAEDIAVIVRGKIIRVLNDGIEVRPSEGSTMARPFEERVVHHEMRQGTGLDAHKQVPYNWAETVTRSAPAKLPDYIFIVAPTASHYEGELIEMHVYPFGTATHYNTTLLSFTVDRNDHVRFMAAAAVK